MDLYAKNREEWHSWLEENHACVKGLWLIYYKKQSGKPRIPYNEAVEEALSFGWIDGKIKRVNDECYMQWFTPRRPGSRWSKLNIGRAQKLIKEGRMKPEGLAAYNETRKNPGLIQEINAQDNISIPEDLIYALKKNVDAYRNFMNFTQSGRSLYVFWLNSAKKEETRKNRIDKIVERSEKNVKAGMI